MLDKTGTITLGNRQASAFVPAEGVTEQQTIGGFRTARLPGGRTPEGRSIVVLAKQRFNLRSREMLRSMRPWCRSGRRRALAGSTSIRAPTGA